MEVTLSVSNGTLSLSGTSGLVFMVGDGNSNTSMTFAGTAADINAALDGLMFNPDAGYQGLATLRIISDDLGNSGAGGALNAVDTVSISVVENTITPVVDTLLPLDELILGLSEEAATDEAVGVASSSVDSDAEEARVSAASAAIHVADDAPGAAGVSSPNAERLEVPASGRGVPGEEAVSPEQLFEVATAELESVDDDKPSSVKYVRHVIRWAVADPLLGAKLLLPVQPESPLWSSLNDMMGQMDDNHGAWFSEKNIYTTTASGVTVTMTAGYVSWLLRTGYLSASMLSVMPLWREFDPLPVLAKSGGRPWEFDKEGKETRESNDIEAEEIFTPEARTDTGSDSGKATS